MMHIIVCALIKYTAKSYGLKLEKKCIFNIPATKGSMNQGCADRDKGGVAYCQIRKNVDQKSAILQPPWTLRHWGKLPPAPLSAAFLITHCLE